MDRGECITSVEVASIAPFLPMAVNTSKGQNHASHHFALSVSGVIGSIENDPNQGPRVC